MITELVLVAVAFVWGSTFVLVKSALDEVSPLVFLAARFSLAGAALGALCGARIRREAPPTPGRPLGAVLAGLFLFGGYAFQTFGLRLTSPSKSAFLTGLCVVMVPLLNAAIYRALPLMAELAGVAIATAGMALMTLESYDLAMESGDLLTLGGAVCFALHFVTVGHYTRRIGYERLTLIQVLTAAALAFATFWWAEDAFARWSPTVLAALGVTALLATAAAFTIVSWAQQHTSATRTALILTLEMVFAWLTSFVVLGEVLAGKVALGAFLILTGVVVVELKPGVRGKLRKR